MKKKQGATVTNWQLHKLSLTKETIEKYYPNKKAQALIFTGTIVKDPTGKLRPGDHMKSSLIVKINKNRTKIETLNTIYTMQNEGNDVFPDIGDNVANIFY